MKSEQDDSSPIAPRGGGLSPPGSFASRRDSWKQPGEPRKIGRIKSFFAKDEIAQVAQAVEEVERTRQEADDALRQQEAKIRQEYAQMMQTFEKEQVEKDAQMQELWQLVQDKDEELNKVVQMNQLMMKKATLQIKLLEQKCEHVSAQPENTQIKLLEEACQHLEQRCQLSEQKCQKLTIERDEAVCALTRAMMVPELKGEEYEALMSVLPEDHSRLL